MHSFEVHSNKIACRKIGCIGLEQVLRAVEHFSHMALVQPMRTLCPVEWQYLTGYKGVLLSNSVSSFYLTSVLSPDPTCFHTCKMEMIKVSLSIVLVSFLFEKTIDSMVSYLLTYSFVSNEIMILFLSSFLFTELNLPNWFLEVSRLMQQVSLNARVLLDFQLFHLCSFSVWGCHSHHNIIMPLHCSA